MRNNKSVQGRVHLAGWKVLLHSTILLCLLCTNPLAAQEGRRPHSLAAPAVKIWDSAPHNAFTDLVQYQKKFFCAFRESARHVPKSKEDNGRIRVLVSADGKQWTSFALLSKEGFDLRDPNLSVTADGRLMMLMGGSVYEGGVLSKMKNHVSFLDRQTKRFSAPEPIVMDAAIQSDHNWLWHLTWQGPSAYGVIYQKAGNTAGRQLYLVKTEDGINYSLVTRLDQDELANEVAVHFLADLTMVLAVRRDADKKDPKRATGQLGFSKPPYQNWEWQETGIRLGGPELVSLSSGELLLGTRAFKDSKPYTGIFVLEPSGEFRELFALPSGGDNSYPGMLVHRNKLWVSYYSSHEGNARIYLSALPLKEVKKAMKTK